MVAIVKQRRGRAKHASLNSLKGHHLPSNRIELSRNVLYRAHLNTVKTLHAIVAAIAR